MNAVDEKEELRILMLEDTITDAELAERELKKAGLNYVLKRVETRQAFIDALEAFRPHVVLSDYKLPEFDGLSALELVRSRYPDIPVIMVTGALRDFEAVDLIHAGARDYVLKDRLARLAPAVTRSLAAARDARARKKAEESLLRVNRTLRALSAGNHALLHASSESELLGNMCQAVTEGGYLMAWVGYAMQDEKKSIVPAAFAGQGVDYLKTIKVSWADEPWGQGPSGLAVRLGQTQICNDIRSDPRMRPWAEQTVKYGFVSSISLPLRVKGASVGVLTLYSNEAGAFEDDQVALLEEMAADLAFGIASLRTRTERDMAVKERQRYVDELRASLEDALQAISATLEMRDPYTAGHQRRVAHLAAAIAREMGLNEEQIHGIRLAGFVHDVGKIHVPAEILSKPGGLNEIEYGLIKMHPQSGYDILKGISFPWPIAQTVLQHHERLDGSGYPAGLTGGHILLEAQIIAVADVVEAMASHRPYRAGLGLPAAQEEIVKWRGMRYNAEVVDACIRLFREKHFGFDDFPQLAAPGSPPHA